MRRHFNSVKIVASAIVFTLLILVTSCTKKAPTAPTNLTAELDGDCIHLSWNIVPHADFYRITVGFHIIDGNNEQREEIYEVFLCETSNNTYNDRYPFDGMNYYKIEAVNEYGSGSFSEISCNYSESSPFVYYLFPNPTNSRVTFMPSWESAYDNTINHLMVVNVLGQNVCDVNFINGSTLELETSQLEAGIYLAHLCFEDSEVVKRFVVAHE